MHVAREASAALSRAGAKPGLGILAYAMACGLLPPYVVPYEIGAYVEGFGYDPARAGLLGTIEIGALAATTMGLAPLAGIWSPRKVALSGAALGALAQFWCMTPLDFQALLCARAFAGVGSGLILAAINAVVAVGLAPEQRYGRVNALMSLLFAIGLWLLPRFARCA